MFESLSDKLKSTLKNLRGEGKLTSEHVDVALREIRMALLEAELLRGWFLRGRFRMS